MGILSKIKADIIIQRLTENFGVLKKNYPNEPEKIYWGLFFTILKPIKPFKNFKGEDIQDIIRHLIKLNDLEKGFNFLSLLVYEVIVKKIKDSAKIREVIIEYVEKR
jgi:hypothetical protein